MRSSSLLPLVTPFFIAGLVISVFALPTGYACDETCPVCQGKGVVTCDACDGTGRCWLCNGTGKTYVRQRPSHDANKNRDPDVTCYVCGGTGLCIVCGGTGQHKCDACEGTGIVHNWMYNLTGATVVLSIISIFLFLAFLGSTYIYMSLAKHNKKWNKRQTILNLILAICFAILLFTYLSPNEITQETLATGALFTILITSLFSFIFHKSYTTKLRT